MPWFKYGSNPVKLFRSFPNSESAMNCALKTLKSIFYGSVEVIILK